MHAASVHPEPGSNSRKICINTTHTGCTYLFPSLFCSYLLVRVSSSKEFRDSYFRTYIALYLSLLFNFQGSMPPHFSVPAYLSIPPTRFRATFIYYHFSFRLSRAFQKFFQLFSSSPNSLPRLATPFFRDSFIRLPHPLYFVNPFFKSFFLFSRKDPKGQLRAKLIGRIWKNIAGALRQYYSKTGRNL